MVSKVRKDNDAQPMMANKQPVFAFIVLLLAMLSCVLDEINSSSPTPTWTPAPQTGVDFLRYDVPNYTYTLSPGESVLGTGLRYASRSGSDYSLTVDNAPLITPGSTQVVWEGIIRPSVFTRYNFQISPQPVSDNLNVNGPVTLIVFRPSPSELTGLPPETVSGAIQFKGISVGETASVGQRIAGTSLIYDGERNGAAAFSGTVQTALHPQGSTFIWYGELLDNVFIKQTLTVTSVSVDSVRLEGTAEIWIIPNE